MKMTEACQLYERALSLADEALKEEARDILRRHPELNECVAAMGSILFTDLERRAVYKEGTSDPELFGLQPFVDDYEAMFGQTYGPWRFTASGPIRTDW